MFFFLDVKPLLYRKIAAENLESSRSVVVDGIPDI